RELRLVARQPDTSVLLILDQVEDLLGYAPNGEASCFLPLLRAAISGPGSPFFVLGTLYSDFLGDFQKHAALREMPFEQIAMSTMSVNFRGSITRPVTSLPLAPRLHCWLSTEGSLLTGWLGVNQVGLEPSRSPTGSHQRGS